MPHRIPALHAAERHRCEAMLANDIATLDALINADLYFSHANGAVDDKAAYMAKLQAGRIVYRSINWSEETVALLGNSALLNGRMTSQVQVEGVDKLLDNRVMSVWTWHDGWRLRAFQSTPLPSPEA